MPLKHYLYTILLCLLTYPAFAQEQDSLTNMYLSAKDEAIRFIKNQDQSASFEMLLASEADKVANLTPIEQATFHIQFAKKHLKAGIEVDSLLLVSVQMMRESNCLRGLGEAMFFIGARAIDDNKSEVLHNAFNEAALCFEKTDYELGVVYALSRMANYYSKSDNFELAEKYNQQLLGIVKNTDDRNLKEMVYLNVANFYTEQAETEQALKYYKLLEASLKISNNKRRLKPLYNNLGVIYIYKHDWPNAKEYINKSLTIKRQENDSLGMFASYQNLFRISIKTKQLQDAEYYHTLLNEWLGKLKVPNEQVLSFKFNTTDYYILRGEPDKAQRAFYDFSSDKDSISNAVFSDQLIDIEEAFEIERRDQKIKLLEQEDELQQAQLKSLKITIVFIIAFIVVLLVNGFYMKRQWIKLLRADEQLKVKQSEILSVNKRLEQSNKSKERILSVIGHDLRGPVGGLKELVELYMELPELEPNDIDNLLKTARESSSSAYYLLENLLTWANSQRGEISFKPQTTPIYPVIKKSVELLDQSINNKNIRFNIDMETSLSLKVDINMFRAIIRNLVSNAIKYSPENGEVKIHAEWQQKHVCISINDQGKGIAAEQVEQIFDKKETYYIGSDVSKKGSGLGLILCKEFVDYHGGKIWVESIENSGTKVSFIIPTSNKRINTNISLKQEFAQ
ncbi:tetratricopeptide repeat-containing sensor histidine kinase [Carboxylicivirga sp. RSCT41]|uniref:tetratricopeptide repeat-containing sensor histidine kinase n=1 Tax=Carboxylicivirga agarovorans TaxID=3417570 RepID=UPI003D337667